MTWHSLLKRFTEKSEKDSETGKNIEIATSVLFLEMAHADFNISRDEELHMMESIKTLFNMNEEEAAEILEIAHNKRNERTDIWFFASQIKENLDRADKIKLIERLWELVYADGHKDKYEDALMRKISKLLGLSHGDMIQAKLKLGD